MRKVKLNCNIGCNSEDAYDTELEKIRGIKESGYIPDIGDQGRVPSRCSQVESNPTSNLMIGPFDMYKELPTMKLSKGNVNVSVNTDAKGVFSTSLYTEYSLLALAMQKDGKDWNTIETIITGLISNSREQRFRKVKLTMPIC